MQTVHNRNIMQSFSTFIRISGYIPEVEKALHWLMIGKIVLHTGKNPSKERHCQSRLVCSWYSCRVWVQHKPGKLCNLYPHLSSMETVFSALKLTQNYYINMNIWTYKTWKFNSIFLTYKHNVFERLYPKFSKSLLNWKKCESSTYNLGQNIWNKIELPSKTGQEKKSLVSVFACC